MNQVKIFMAALLLCATMAGCYKKADIGQDQVSQRKILVMVSGEPKAYVWSMGGTMGAAVAFGLIGSAAAAGVATEKGETFQQAVTDYPLQQRVRDNVVEELSRTVDQEVVPVCLPGEEPSAAGCVELKSMEEIDQCPGQLVLAIMPCEYGLRNQVPYLALVAALFDTDSKKAVWQQPLVVGNDDIPVEPQDLKQWVEKKDEVCSCIDGQIKKMAAEVAETVKNGKPPEKDSQAWVFMGCSYLKLEKCVQDQEAL